MRLRQHCHYTGTHQQWLTLAASGIVSHASAIAGCLSLLSIGVMRRSLGPSTAPGIGALTSLKCFEMVHGSLEPVLLHALTSLQHLRLEHVEIEKCWDGSSSDSSNNSGRSSRNGDSASRPGGGTSRNHSSGAALLRMLSNMTNLQELELIQLDANWAGLSVEFAALTASRCLQRLWFEGSFLPTGVSLVSGHADNQ